MRSSRATSRARAAAVALWAVAGLGLAGPGCAPDLRESLIRNKIERAEQLAAMTRDRLEGLLPGKWTGSPVEAPEGVWFERASFELTFSDGGDVSMVASTFARRPYALRFEGSYDVLDGDQVRVEEANVGGIWRVERASEKELTLVLPDMKLRLVRRYGS